MSDSLLHRQIVHIMPLGVWVHHSQCVILGRGLSVAHGKAADYDKTIADHSSLGFSHWNGGIGSLFPSLQRT